MSPPDVHDQPDQADPVPAPPIAKDAVVIEEDGAPPAGTERGAPPPEQADSPVMVLGRDCAQRHLNHPDAVYCNIDGKALWNVTAFMRPGPRPPLGVLVDDIGNTRTVDRDLVVGRDPAGAELPTDLRGMAMWHLSDPDRSVGRAHAVLRLEEWTLKVGDLGSRNGTYVKSHPGEGQWRSVGAELVDVPPGAIVAFGRRVLRYHSHHVVPQSGL